MGRSGFILMLDKLKNLFAKKEEPGKNWKESKEPQVRVVNTDFDENNPRQGFMELEWNPAFITFLKEHNYQGNNEEEIVDKWFTDLCKNIGQQMDEESKFVADADVLPKKRRKVDKKV
jgi:hypothetical protein